MKGARCEVGGKKQDGSSLDISDVVDLQRTSSIEGNNGSRFLEACKENRVSAPFFLSRVESPVRKGIGADGTRQTEPGIATNTLGRKFS